MTRLEKHISYIVAFLVVILISTLVTQPTIVFPTERTTHDLGGGGGSFPGMRGYLEMRSDHVTRSDNSTSAWDQYPSSLHPRFDIRASRRPSTSIGRRPSNNLSRRPSNTVSRRPPTSVSRRPLTRVSPSPSTSVSQRPLTRVSPSPSTSVSGGYSTEGPRMTTTTGFDGHLSEELEIPAELRRLRPKILDDLPVRFLPEYKNPCYDNGAGVFTCLPYMFLLGLPKCGTTDLWRKIRSHPYISAVRKEPHWWTRQSTRKGFLTLSAYSRRFMKPAIKGEHSKEIVLGDASASTFWDNHNWVSTYPEYAEEGPPYIVADVIRAVLPNAKLVVIYRDPTERLYSDYVYFHHVHSISPKDFHTRVTKTLDMFNNCTASGRSERACAYDVRGPARSHIGLYPIYTRDWLERFPRDQFMFIELSDWHESCERILPELFEFLDVEALQHSNITAICEQKEANVQQKKKESVGKMLNKTRTLLRNFYRPYVLQLAELLGNDKFLWGYSEE